MALPALRCTIRGGTLVTPSGTRRADLGIGDDGRIAAIEPSLPAGREDIDATDLFLLPGGVDSHCHIEQRTSSGLTPVDDFYSASVSALAGGTTTVVPFACQHRGKRIRDVVADYRAVAAKAAVDYAFHVIVTDPSETHAIDDLQACFAHGCSSVKVYMTYDALKLNDTEMLDVLELCRRHAAMVMVHAESHDLIAWITSRLLNAGRIAAKFHAVARPAIAEREATHRAISFAEFIGTPLLVVHVSGREAADEIARARHRGVPIYGETCPQYLTLTLRCLCAPLDGSKFLCSPPLRTEADQEALWEALRRGDLQVISSDHSAYNFAGGGDASKTAGGASTPFSKVPMGLPGLECRMPLLVSGYLHGRLDSLQQVARLGCEMPARLYGLYPRKGVLEVGSDADVVLWDLEARGKITKEALHDELDYTPFEGMAVRGEVRRTILRGRTVFERDTACCQPCGGGGGGRSSRVTAPRGSGEYIACVKPALPDWSGEWPDGGDVVAERCIGLLGPALDGEVAEGEGGASGVLPPSLPPSPPPGSGVPSQLTLRPLRGVGVEVLGVSAASISEAAEGSPLLRRLAAVLDEHLLVLLHGDSGGDGDGEGVSSGRLSPSQLRQLYSKLHAVRFPGVSVGLPPERPPPSPIELGSTNLRGRCFPGYPETNVVGFAAAVDWHGLKGRLEPSAWWERRGGQYHHDGGFSASAPPPPALVAMYCEEAPSVGGGTRFFSTRLVMELAPPDVAARARRMRCRYTRGFGRVSAGEYPVMSCSHLTPTAPPPSERDGAAASPPYQSITEFESLEALAFGHGGADAAEYYHRLVQRDSRGREYVVVHSVCLDRLEELLGEGGEGGEERGEASEWQPWSWSESQAFVEALLAPAAASPTELAWTPGDVALWDNLQTQHSVTPSEVYTSDPKQRRLMTRTAMQPLQDVLAS